MFYTLLRYITQFAFRLYFRKLYIYGADQIPKDKPVILACNHPSAFMEACLLACFLPRPLHFLTRGDMFKGTFMKWVLRQTNQIPIYRFRDGFGNLRNNQGTFQICYERLAEGKMLLIFSEAKTELEKRMRPIQRGTAKLALGAMQFDPSMELHVVPVAVSYQEPRKSGTVVSFHISPPFEVYKLKNLELDDQKENIAVITDYISKEICEHMVQILNPERSRVTERILTLHRNRFEIPDFPFVEQNVVFLTHEIALADRIADLSDNTYKELSEKLEAYDKQIDKLGVTDYSLARKGNWTLFEMLFWIPSAVFFLVGYIASRPPLFLYSRLIDPRITSEPFRGPIRLISGFALGGIYFLFLTLFLWLWVGELGLLIGGFLFMLGYFSHKHHRWIRSGYDRWKLFFTSREKTKALNAKALFLVQELLQENRELVFAQQPYTQGQ